MKEGKFCVRQGSIRRAAPNLARLEKMKGAQRGYKMKYTCEGEDEHKVHTDEYSQGENKSHRDDQGGMHEMT